MQIINFIKSKLEVAKEHIENYDINHTPTIMQAIHAALIDYILYNVIYDDETGAYLVYEVIRKPTLGIRVANITSIYVPKKHRFKGVASELINRIPENIVIGDTDAKNSKSYSHCGNIYRVR